MLGYSLMLKRGWLNTIGGGIWLAACLLSISTSEAASIQLKASVSKLEMSGKWGDVIAILSKETKDEWVYRHLANAYLRNDDCLMAEASYEKAIELDKRNAYAYLGIGDIAIAQQHWERAIEFIEKGLSLNPQNAATAGVFNNYGYALYRLKRYEEASTMFDKALARPKVEQTYVELFLNAAANEGDRGNFSKAEEICKQGITIFPQHYWCWENLGWIQEMQRRQEDSLNSYKQACALAYRDPSIKHRTEFSLPFKGRWYVSQGNGGEATHVRLKNHFAWDFTVHEKDLSYLGQGKENRDHFCFEKEVLAPADGEVMFVKDDVQDSIPVFMNYVNNLNGNCIVIKHQPGEFTELLHLRQNSIKVKVGDRVKRGQVIALVGNSGSRAPHLHFSLVSTPRPEARISLPSQFSNYLVTKDGEHVAIKNGVPQTGEEVENSDEKMASATPDKS
jgi:tetratricopeptide (TPR) repeat protein